MTDRNIQIAFTLVLLVTMISIAIDVHHVRVNTKQLVAHAYAPF